MTCRVESGCPHLDAQLGQLDIRRSTWFRRSQAVPLARECRATNCIDRSGRPIWSSMLRPLSNGRIGGTRASVRGLVGCERGIDGMPTPIARNEDGAALEAALHAAPEWGLVLAEPSGLTEEQ